MTAQAPVCHIPPVTTTTQPGPVALPSVPPAQPNVQSLTATVNALRQLVMLLAGQLAGQHNTSSRPARWTEASRTTTKVKIYQDNDPNTGNFVEVEQLNKLVMQDGVTGESWTWNR